VPKYTYNNNWGASFLLEEIEEHLGFVGILNGLNGRGTADPKNPENPPVISDFDVLTIRDLTRAEKEQLDALVESYTPDPEYTNKKLAAIIKPLIDAVPTDAEVEAIASVDHVKLVLKQQNKILFRLIRLLVSLEEIEDPI